MSSTSDEVEDQTALFPQVGCYIVFSMDVQNTMDSVIRDIVGGKAVDALTPKTYVGCVLRVRPVLISPLNFHSD